MINVAKKDPVPAQGDVKPPAKGVAPVGNQPPGPAGMGPPAVGQGPGDPNDPAGGKGRGTKKTKPQKDPPKTKVPPAQKEKDAGPRRSDVAAVPRTTSAIRPADRS